MNYHISLINNSYIYITLDHNLTTEDVDELIKKMRQLENKLHQQEKPALILCKLNGIQTTSSAVRFKGAEGIKSLNYDKCAVYGTNSLVRTLSELVIAIAGVGNRTKLFKTEQEAREWLNIQ